MAIKELHNEIKEDEQLGISDPLNTSQDATLAQTEIPSGSFSNISSGEEIIQNGQIRSGNFAAGTTGWQIKADGDVEFNSGTFRSQLIAGSIDIPDTTTVNSFHVDSNGNAWWGAALLANSVAEVLNTGAAKFTSGTIGGWTIAATTLVGGNITLDQANDKITVGAANGIVINGATSEITSNDGTTWKIDGDGTLTGFSSFGNGTTTKDASDASATQNIAHGLGVIPKKVRVKCIWGTSSSIGLFTAETIYNGTSQSSQSYHSDNTGGGNVYKTAATFRLNSAGTTGYQEGVVTFDATNIIITWTKSGSPTGIYYLLWEAET